MSITRAKGLMAENLKKIINYKVDEPSVGTKVYESLTFYLKMLGISDITMSPVFHYVILDVG